MHNEEVAAWLRRQYGLITRAQAVGAGSTDRRISQRVRSGTWAREYPGVYRHSVVPASFHSRVLAACLYTGGLASHRAAARLHGIHAYGEAEPEIVVRHGRWLRIDRVRVHLSTQFDRTAAIKSSGISTTGLARTVLDLGAVGSRRRQEQAVDQVLRERRVTPELLYRTLVQHARRGRDGCGPMREILEERFGEERIPLSHWSRMVSDLLVDAGLVPPVLEHRIADAAGNLLAQVDLAYPASRVAIELDSVRWHLDRESFERDRRRWNRLVLAGWTTLAFTWADFVNKPRTLVAQVRASVSPPN